MSWQASAFGETINHSRPETTPIRLTTIAHALAGINRWGGHAKFAYPVAAHSLMVARLMMRRAPEGERLRWGRVGLLHDAHEAYTTDLPTPIKRQLGRAWREFEDRWQDHVRLALGVEKDCFDLRNELKECDRIALVTEREAICNKGTESWGEEIEATEPDAWELANFPLRELDSELWEREFLFAARTLEVPGA